MCANTLKASLSVDSDGNRTLKNSVNLWLSQTMIVSAMYNIIDRCESACAECKLAVLFEVAGGLTCRNRVNVGHVSIGTLVLRFLN